MSDHDKPWWQGRLPPDHDFAFDLDSFWDGVADLDDRDMAEQTRALAILEPPGHLVPAPATYAGWRFYLDMADVRFPYDDGRDELPRPVVLIDIARHDAIVREKEGRAG